MREALAERAVVGARRGNEPGPNHRASAALRSRRFLPEADAAWADSVLATSPWCSLSVCLTGSVMGADGGGRPATQWPICSCALLVVSEAWLVMCKKDLGNKITAGSHFGFGEYVPQMPLHSVDGDHQMIGDVDG